MFLSALLLLGVAGSADSTLLRVLSINDLHGTLEPRVYGWSSRREVGGAAVLKATFDSAAARCRCPVLRLDGGDELQGTLTSNLVYGRSTIEVLNTFGLDAAVVGNHELDWGVDTLRARMRQSNYPWLAANVFDSTSGKRPAWATPWRIVERGGLRIGLVGYMSARTRQMVGAWQAAGLVWREGATPISDALDSVRARRPDVTILIAHEGGFCDSLPCRGEVVSLARELDSTRVQLIVAGHSHTLMNTVVNGIPIMQARSNGTAWAQADLVRRADGNTGWTVTVETAWADRVAPDPGVVAILARYRPMVDSLARRKVAVLRDSLLRRGAQYPLGNLIADAQRAARPGIDFAIMNNGGIRRDLFPGPVSYGDLFELQPFSNFVTRVTLTGAQMQEIMERAVQSGRPFLHISGLVVRYDSRLPAGHRVVSMRRPDGTAVRPGRSYVLGLSDFLKDGGDGLAVLRPLRDQRTGWTDLEVLVRYLRAQRQPVVAPAAPRFIDIAP